VKKLSEIVKQIVSVFAAVLLVSFFVPLKCEAFSSERFADSLLSIAVDAHAKSSAEEAKNSPSEAFSMLVLSSGRACGTDLSTNDRTKRLWVLSGRPNLESSAEAMKVVSLAFEASGADDMESEVLKKEKALFTSFEKIGEYIERGGRVFVCFSGDSPEIASKVLDAVVNETFRRSSGRYKSARSVARSTTAAEKTKKYRPGGVVLSVDGDGLRILRKDGESVMSFADAERKILYAIGMRRTGKN